MKTSIPTKFEGTVYRSKTEAQFAYLFTKLGIKFLYEPENFSVGGLGYCPDFHLTDLDIWFEVKGEMTTEDENKICGFEAITDNKVFIGKVIDKQMFIMDIDDNDLSDDLFGDFDPEEVSNLMTEAVEYDFSEPTKPTVNKKDKLVSVYAKYIMKLGKGGTFYHFSEDRDYIYNEIFERNSYGEYIKEPYWIKISVDDEGWYNVALYNEDEELFCIPTEYGEYVTKLCQQEFRTAYEFKHTDDDYNTVLNRGISKALAISQMGHT